MTLEEKGKPEGCTRDLSEILYRNVETKDAKQFKKLEGIEIAVREQMLHH